MSGREVRIVWENECCDVEKLLTDVTICHASAKSRDTNIQRMYVESNDTMRVKNMEFVNSSESVNSPSDSCSWTDLTVMKTEANVR